MKDDKTPTAETFSPIMDKPKIITNLPPPKSSDFLETDTDPYSELCSEQLDNLEEIEEDNDNITKQPPRPKSVNLKLQPLDVQKEIDSKSQKLTTPGKIIYLFILKNI